MKKDIFQRIIFYGKKLVILNRIQLSTICTIIPTIQVGYGYDNDPFLVVTITICLFGFNFDFGFFRTTPKWTEDAERSEDA